MAKKWQPITRSNGLLHSTEGNTETLMLTRLAKGIRHTANEGTN
jgi:hypothetical protein